MSMNWQCPLGLMTSGRVEYLDATLRSLSASGVPDGQRLVVFDDAKAGPDAARARQYLDTAGTMTVPGIQHASNFGKVGLGALKATAHPAKCVGDKVFAYKLACGNVVQASHLALRKLAAWFPDAPAYILLQDDVVFRQGWLPEFVAAAEALVAAGVPLGVYGGLRLNKELPEGGPSQHGDRWSAFRIPDSTTAQCLLVTAPAVRALDAWLAAPTARTRQFDDYLCKESRNVGFEVWLHTPYVGQHFGVVSTVRPGLSWWARGQAGRVGFHVTPPFEFGDEVRMFPGRD